MSALYFQFGRYLLICSSQPGGQAANLQGIWNYKLRAPWDGKYTTDINVEMNYWPAEVTNLSEMHEPFIKLIKETADKGKESAAMYGCRGWTLHHNTDIWRSTGLSMVQHTEYGQPVMLGFASIYGTDIYSQEIATTSKKHIP
jgi:alpha-L-fucosidase 2